MRTRLLLPFLTLLASHWCEARAQSLWVTLRPYAKKTVEVADTVLPSGDTLFLRLTVPDTTLRVDLTPRGNGFQLNTAGFQLNYRPLTSDIRFRSQYSPEARRDTFLTGRHSLGVKASLDDPAGLTPIDRARLETIFAQPRLMRRTWNEIPDWTKEIREGRLIHSDEGSSENLSRIFKPDASFVVDNLKEKAKAKESPWTLSGVENLQLSQLALSNWTKGGENNLAFIHDFRWTGVFKKSRSEWESSLTSILGLSYTSTLKGRVSNDQFNVNSKYGFNAVNKWYYSFLFTFKTQLFRNYSSSDIEKTTPKSTMLSPTYMQVIFGMDYKREGLSILLSPYTAAITLVVDTATIDQTSFGIDEDKKANVKNGFSVTANWKKTIIYGIYYTTKLELFYEYFKKDGNKRFDWENVIEMQINRYLSTRFLVEFRYFDNESDKFQLRENFSIAFKYSF